METPPSRVLSRAANWRRRRRIGAVLLAVALLLPAAWVISHSFPRTEAFAARRGPVVNAEVGPTSLTDQGYHTQPVSVSASTGLRVNFRVLRPAGPPGRHPLVVLLAGHRTGRDAVDVLGDPGNLVIAALDYPYHGPERPRGVAQSLQAIPAIQRGLLDTPPAVSVALDWLLDQPYVDPSRVELMGVSLGVIFAAVAGAEDERFRRVWLVHGSIDNRAWMANRLERRLPNRPARELAATLLHTIAYGETFRAQRWVPRIAPREVVIVGADADEQVPRDDLERLHALAREPRTLLWSEGPHVDTHRTDIIRQLIDMVRQRIHQPMPAIGPAAGGP